MMCTRETEIQSLTLAVRDQLALRLDPDERWKQLAMTILHPDTQRPIYSHNFITSLQRMKGSPTMHLLQDWGTRGRSPPTILTLMELLLRNQLYIAADYLAEDVLREERPPRPWTFTETRTTDNEILVNVLPDIASESVDACAPIAPQSDDPCYTYHQVLVMTEGFNRCRLIGRGGYGSVFLAIGPGKTKLAVKVLEDRDKRQFVNELEIMMSYHHDNLLPLLGYCHDSKLCIVTPYMENGSLQDWLARSRNQFTWADRLRVAIETARGLVYLHTAMSDPMIHRDVKSGNILLDKDLTAKVADFGISRVGSDADVSTRVVTAHPRGTAVYMAPEASRGDVSPKVDTFSYGVVVYELLSGLPPYDHRRQQGHDLLTYVQDSADMNEWLDPAVDWPPSVASSVAEIAEQCVIYEKKRRPYLQNVLPAIEALLP